MAIPDTDRRSKSLREDDERIANEPHLAPLDLSSEAVALPIEKHLTPLSRHPVAMKGVVENGLVRLLDPTIHLPEHSRVIVVATDAT
jgi:hypothetical protein